MPIAIKTPFAPLTAVVSKYISSHKARVQAQKEASGTTSGPTGAEVDAHVASTFSRRQGVRYLAGQQLHLVNTKANAATEANANTFFTVQVDEEGRTLGFEDPNDPTLQDDPATRVGLRATARPLVVPTTPITDPSLLSEVSEVTYGAQTSIPSFPAPPAPTLPISPALIEANQYGFTDPRLYGGTSFDLANSETGTHEPLNVIISSHSSPSILTRKGLQSYLRSLSFDRECLGLHSGGYQKAYVDPRGWRDQEFIYRQVYTPLDYVFGTCVESLVGGNHVRAWQQQGTGAWFLATSKEENVREHHMIVPNGYNVGRNELVEAALGKNRDGKTSFMGSKFRTSVEFVAGLMPQGVQGVNHDIAVDGLTAVLTVTVGEEKSWFSAKNAVPLEGEEVHDDDDEEAQGGDVPMALGAIVPASEEEAEEVSPQETKEDKKRARRMSLAKRFSLGRAPKQQSQEGKSKEEGGLKSPVLWQKLKNMAAPKHSPTSPTAATQGEKTSDTVVAAVVGDEAADGRPSSIDSASTAADVAQPAVAKAQPTQGAAAPALAPAPAVAV